MSAKRLYICLIGFLLFLTIEPVQSQDSIGVNLVKQQVDKVIKGDKKSRFFNHIGYRRAIFPDDEDHFMLKYGFEGFENGKWRLGIYAGFGNFVESFSLNVRAYYRTFRMVDLFAEIGLDRMKKYGLTPTMSIGTVLYDDYEFSYGLLYDDVSGDWIPQTGFGINLHSPKKSLIAHGIFAGVVVLAYGLLVIAY